MKQGDECMVWLAAAIRDAAGTSARPGAVAVRGGRILASGEASQVLRQAGAKAQVFHLQDRLLLPAMVNAHAHLELSPIGPQPYGGDFLNWVVMLMSRRPKDPDSVFHAVTNAARASLAAGVGFIGDVAGQQRGGDAAARALGESGLPGVSFAEIVGIAGERVNEALAWLNSLSHQNPRTGCPRLGIQPHAPYSTGPTLYQAAIDTARLHGLPLSTHLAELPEETQFVGRARGRLRQFLESLGVWQDEFQKLYGQGLTPVRWMAPFLKQAPWLLAHCNYLSDDDLAILADSRASVAYCPVASAYFRHPAPGHPPHRYREMLEAGVNVCLGTDSILCQPPPPEEPQPLGILPQMRFLYRRDRTDPDLLLRMATVNGLRALGLDEGLATLQAGAEARLIAVKVDPDEATDPLIQALLNDSIVEPVHPAGPPVQG